MGSDPVYEVKYLPTGLLPVDCAFQGGLPRGRFVEVTGAYSTLKSYIGLHAIAETQRNGGIAALIDTEHAYDPDWAREIGVNTDELILWPDLSEVDGNNSHTGEEAIDAAEVLIRNGVDLIVFDSIAAALPQAEADKRLSKESVQPARLAALMSVACRRLTAANSSTAVMWINQVREQVGVMFGNPEKPTGGRAMGFYTSVRLNLRLVGKETQDVKVFTGNKNTTSKMVIRQNFKITIEKSKLSRPWREIFFDYSLEDGGEIDVARFVFAQCVESGAVINRGKTWEYGKVKVVGKEKFINEMKTNPTLFSEMEEEVRRMHSLTPSSSHRGKSAAGRKSGARSKSGSRKSAARGSTPTVVRGASNGTLRRKKT